MLSLLEGALDDYAVLHIASYSAPSDLVSLALTCRRFGYKFGTATRRESRRLAREAKRQKTSISRWSLMDEAARSVVEKTMTNEERISLRLRDGDSWMSRYNELLLLRRPLTFDRLIGMDGSGIVLSSDKSKASLPRAGRGSALSDYVMRGGKHYATFTLAVGLGRFARTINIGVFRPTKGREGLSSPIGQAHHPELAQQITDAWGEGQVHCCAFKPFSGFCIWSDLEQSPNGTAFRRCWRGEIAGSDDVVGLLLDLDEGTMSVYKNGRRLGVMKDGLAGEYCWFVDMICCGGRFSVKIRRQSVPAEI